MTRADRILTANAGSSSVKLRLVGETDEVLAGRDLEVDPSGDNTALEDDLSGFLEELSGDGPEIGAVGHRFVHGGPTLTGSVLVDVAVVRRLRELTDLDPLHAPTALRALEAIRKALPDVPAVACFDTTFHTGLPAAARTYAVPWSWTTELGVRRYGFHGLSFAWSSRRAAELTGQPLERLRTVICHLGSGASLAAVDGGRSVDTTMGMTPLEGLVMSTRSGSVDPGALLWVQQRTGQDPGRLRAELERDGGLAALSGRSGSLSEVLEAAAGGDERAGLAADVYVHRLAGAVAAMTAALGGLDVLVFTGGVGEHSAELRRRACARLGFLGVDLDETANRDAGEEDADLSGGDARVRVLLVHAREDLEIAGETRRLTTARHDRSSGRVVDQA